MSAGACGTILLIPILLQKFGPVQGSAFGPQQRVQGYSLGWETPTMLSGVSLACCAVLAACSSWDLPSSVHACDLAVILGEGWARRVTRRALPVV